VPEEQPCEELCVFQVIGEAEVVVLVEFLGEIDQFRTRFMNSERRRDSVVENDRDSSVRIPSKPVILKDGQCKVLKVNGIGRYQV